MLLLLLCFLLLSIVFWGWGIIFLHAAAGKAEHKLADVVMAGLAFSGLLAGLWYCFLPADNIFALGICFTGFTALVMYRNVLMLQLTATNRKTWIVSFLVFLFLAFKAVVPNDFYDNGLYYIQTLKWVGSHAVVPGLANLHFRLGTISLWHILMAPFYQGIFGGFDDLGEFLFIWFFIGQFEIILKNQGFDGFLSFFILMFVLVFASHFFGTGSPDLACGIFGIYCLSLLKNILNYRSSPLEKSSSPDWIYVLISAFFLTGVKLSGIPFILAPLICFLAIEKQMRFRFFIVMFLLGCLSFGPLVYRSWVLSGYLLFPVFKGPLCPDWQVPARVVQEYVLLIKGFARHILSSEEILKGNQYTDIGKLSFDTWFPMWLEDRTIWDMLVLFPVLAGWITLIWSTHKKIRQSFSVHWPKIPFTWMCSFLLVFWFFNAPDIRFAMGIFGFLFACFFAVVFIRIKEKTGFSLVRYGFHAGLVSSILCIFLFRNRAMPEHYLLQQGNIQNGHFYQRKTGEGRYLYFARNDEYGTEVVSDQCWDAPLPCAPKWEKGLRFRGARLQDGFRMEK